MNHYQTYFRKPFYNYGYYSELREKFHFVREKNETNNGSTQIS